MEEFCRPWNPAEPPLQQKRVAKLVRVPATTVLRGFVTCDQVWELLTHWHQGRTSPCLKRSGYCPLCGIAPERPFGLIQIFEKSEDARLWVQLTVHAADKVQQWIDKGHTLLGADVEIGRIRKTEKAPIWVTLEQGYRHPDRMPKPEAPHEALARVFTALNRPRLAETG